MQGREERGGGGVGTRFFLNLSKTIFLQHLPFSVAVRLSLRHILKGRVYGLAHAHESKCCFFVHWRKMSDWSTRDHVIELLNQDGHQSCWRSFFHSASVDSVDC